MNQIHLAKAPHGTDLVGTNLLNLQAQELQLLQFRKEDAVHGEEDTWLNPTLLK